MGNAIVEIILILGLLIINGIFAMSELALISSRKIRLQQKAEEGNKAARAAMELAESPNRFLSTTQIGISLIGILAGAVGGATLADRFALFLQKIPSLKPYSEEIAFTIIVLLTTYFSLVIGELIPKRIALNDPEKITLIIAGPMRFLARLTSPIVALLSKSTDLGLRLLGLPKSTEPIVTEEEIKVLMEQGTQSGIFEEAEQDMVEGIFRLNDRFIDSIMTPRTEILWIDMDESPEEIVEVMLRSRHSRFPAAHDSLDNVQGILSARDFLGSLLEPEPVPVENLLQPPLFVPESMSALRVLEMIKLSGVHEALVLDEYGGLLGMVTLYDILKAIVGEIPGFGDNFEPQAVQREDGSWLLDGLLSIDELKDVLNIEAPLPEEDRIGYQTLGGFIMSQLGAIPSSGQRVKWGEYQFEIMDMDGRRVDKVLVSREPLSPGEEQE